jgi:hypothetical protein
MMRRIEVLIDRIRWLTSNIVTAFRVPIHPLPMRLEPDAIPRVSARTGSEVALWIYIRKEFSKIISISPGGKVSSSGSISSGSRYSDGSSSRSISKSREG